MLNVDLFYGLKWWRRRNLSFFYCWFVFYFGEEVVGGEGYVFGGEIKFVLFFGYVFFGNFFEFFKGDSEWVFNVVLFGVVIN